MSLNELLFMRIYFTFHHHHLFPLQQSHIISIHYSSIITVIQGIRFILFYVNFFIKIQLIYNIVSISSVQQIDSVMYIHIYIFFLILFSIMIYPRRLTNSLCYTVGLCFFVCLFCSDFCFFSDCCCIWPFVFLLFKFLFIFN